MTKIEFILGVGFGVGLFVYALLVEIRRDRAERRRLERFASLAGLRPLPGETNEELSERIRAELDWPPPANRERRS